MHLTDNSVIDQLRAKWRQAIVDLGVGAAAEDGATAFVERCGCSLQQARAFVANAWTTLGICPENADLRCD